MIVHGVILRLLLLLLVMIVIDDLNLNLLSLLRLSLEDVITKREVDLLVRYVFLLLHTFDHLQLRLGKSKSSTSALRETVIEGREHLLTLSIDVVLVV